MWIQTKLIRLVIEQRRALLKRFEESEHKPPRQSLNLNRSLGLLGSNPSSSPARRNCIGNSLRPRPIRASQ